MKPTLKKPIRVFVLLPFLSTGLAWLLTHWSLSGLVVCLALLAPGALIASQIGGKRTNWALLLGLLSYAYPLGEITLYTISPPLSATGFNKPNAQPDAIRGYRWIGDSIRYFKHRMGQVVFDNTFYPNSQGWIMKQDYFYDKKDSNTLRWMLFGNSFSAGIMLEENMPNRVQSIFNRELSEQKNEVYSFSSEGVGLMNWYNTFYKEVIPEYQFDGVVLCIYEDNLYRGFTIMQIKEDNCFMVRTDSAGWSEEDSDLSTEVSYDNSNFFYSNQHIDQFLAQPSKPFKWPLKNLISSLFKGRSNNPLSARKPAQNLLELEKKMGLRKYTMLKDIIALCQKENKPLVISSIPAKKLLLETQPGDKNWHQMELELIAREYQLHYFDGYEVFKHMTPEEINAHWLQYDGHWNQKGSNLFADTFALYLNEIGKAQNE